MSSFGVTGREASEVNRFHDNDDIDLTILSHHHTLGISSTQSSPGSHKHKGTDQSSKLSWKDLIDKPIHKISLFNKWLLTAPGVTVGGVLPAFTALPDLTTVFTTFSPQAAATITVTFDVEVFNAGAGVLPPAGQYLIGRTFLNAVALVGDVIALTSNNAFERKGTFSRSWAVATPGIAAGTTYTLLVQVAKSIFGGSDRLVDLNTNVVTSVYDINDPL